MQLITYLITDFLIESDFFEGDLLINALLCEKEYWKNNSEHFLKMFDVIKKNENSLIEIDTTLEIKDSINSAISEFKKIELPITGST